MRIKQKAAQIGTKLLSWDMTVYYLCFILPAVVMLSVYSVLNIAPFGDRSIFNWDLNVQYSYYLAHVKDIIAGAADPFYSWNNALGSEFVGTFAYYAASPFNIIVYLFPAEYLQESVFALILVKIGAIGVSAAAYLKYKRRSSITVIMFSSCYALSMYSVMHASNVMWLDGVFILPVIICGIERLVDKGRMKMLIIAWVYGFVSCFYIGFMLAIFSALYFMYYSLAKDGITVRQFFLRLGQTAAAAAAAVLLSSGILLGALNALSLGKLDTAPQNFSFTEKFAPFLLLGKLLPASYDSLYSVGHANLYVGTFTILFLPLFFFMKNVDLRRKISAGVLSLFMVLSLTTEPLYRLWHGGAEPGGSPGRFSFTLCFFMIILAAEAFDGANYADGKVKPGSVFAGISNNNVSKSGGVGNIGRFEKYLQQYIIGMFFVLLFIDGILANLDFTTMDKRDALPVIGVIMPAMAFLVITAVILLFKNSAVREIVLCAAVFAELAYSAHNTLVKEAVECPYTMYDNYENYVRNTLPVVKEVAAKDKSFYRFEEDFQRFANDPMLLNTRGVSYNGSILKERALKYIAALGLNGQFYTTRFVGRTELTKDLLGFKYVMDSNIPYYNFKSPDDIFVKENYDVLPVAFLGENSVRGFNFTAEAALDNQAGLLKSLAGEKVQALYDDDSDDYDYSDGEIYGDDNYENTDSRLFIPMKQIDVTTDNTTDNYPGGYVRWSKVDKTRDGSVTYVFRAVSDGRAYLHLPCDAEKFRRIKIKHNGYDIGEYFGGYEYSIRDLGDVSAGDELRIELDLTTDEVLFKSIDIATLNDSALKADILKLHKINDNTAVKALTETKLRIDTDYPRDMTLYTTIPYEAGWHATVDGKSAEILQLQDCVIALDMPAGAHTAVLSYMPPWLGWAVACTAAGVVIFVVIARYSRGQGRKFEE